MKVHPWSPWLHPWLVLLSGCARESYRNADLQLEIQAPLPDDAVSVKTCAMGVGVRTHGANGDLYSLPGLPPDAAAVITFDVLTTLGDDTGLDETRVVTARVGPVTLEIADPVVEAELVDYDVPFGATCVDCPPVCEAQGSFSSEETSWLLAIRFSE